MGKGHIKEPKLLNCATCGSEFLGKHYKSKYCSRKCCLENIGIKTNVFISNKKGKYFKLYGITVEGYQALVEKQNAKCAICLEVPTKLYVDHCHDSGIVRGLLCMKCNAALGLFKDKQMNLQNALTYLKHIEELKKVRG